MLRTSIDTTTVTRLARPPTGASRGAKWENVCYKLVEMNKGSQRPPSKWKQQGQGRCGRSETSKKDATEYDDQTSKQEIVNQEAIPQELWNKHLLNPALA